MLLKILFMIPNLGQGGAEKVLVNLVNNMDRDRFDVTIKTLFDVGINKRFLKENIKYDYCFKNTFRANSQILKLFSPEYLYKKFVKEKYDIVVSYLEGPTARIISGCNDPSIKKICWIHVEQHNKETASYSFRNYQEAKKCYSRFDRIICVSNTVKEDFQNIFQLDNKFDVLYNVNETTDIIKKGKEKIGNILVNKNQINICGVGRLTEIKCFDRLIRIHEKLVREYDVHTYLLGDGKEKKKLIDYVEKHNLKDSFTFLGYQENPYKYISKMDLFVCCSTAEGFNTATTEALILGVPVITTLVSGMEEMLGKNKYGIITENNEEKLYEEIKLLLNDKEKLNYYKRQASIRGAFFSTENTVRAVENMLMEL